jgi:hypothetical protein
MYVRCFLLSFLLPLSLSSQMDTITSIWSRSNLPKATETEVQLGLQFVNMRGEPVKQLDCWLVAEKDQKTWRATTDQKGFAVFLLPRATSIVVNVADEEAVKTFKTVDAPYVRSTLGVGYSPKTYVEVISNDTVYQTVPEDQLPTSKRLLLKLLVTDFDGNPHHEERLFFSDKENAKVYVAETDEEGTARLMLPKGDSLFMHTLFERNISDFHFPNDDRGATLNLRFRTIGSKAILARQAERARQAAIRDSLYEVYRVRDSLAALIADTDKERTFKYYMFDGDYSDIKIDLEKRAEKTSTLLKDNPLYFEQSGFEINAALYRNKALWSDKVIVSDLTGSMSPYMDQLMLWHALAIVPGEHNRYLFFNDGDSKRTNEKEIGATGGFYICEDRDIERVYKTMKETQYMGSGGDSPENDVEALLEATRMMGEIDELILIADNYSDVRDLELLSQLKAPVRIVLAGVNHGVNEDYLHLAYMTGGSIHTLEEDIYELTQLNDGETITVGRYRYLVNGGTFIQLVD